MKSRTNSHKRYFFGVAIATLLFGAGILAVGAVEWICNQFYFYGFNNPMSKIIGGAIVVSLGYIHLELELLRTRAKDELL